MDTKKITRIVILDHRHENLGTDKHGRVLEVWNVKPCFELQDGGKTLKIFIDDRDDKTDLKVNEVKKIK